MLQYGQASLTTPTNAVELTGVDLEQVYGSGLGDGFGGLGFGGFSPFGLGGLSPFGPFGPFGFGGFGPSNTIIINVDSFNTTSRRHHHN